MSNEPHSNVDDLLRDYAKARRTEAGPPPELHPVNRRVLHAQVTRTFGRSEPARRTSSFTGVYLWRRIVLGAVMVTAIVIIAGVWLRFQTDRDTRLTMNRDRNLEMIGENDQISVLPRTGVESSTIGDRVRGFESSAGRDEAPAAGGLQGSPEKSRREASPPATEQKLTKDRVNLALSTPAAPSRMEQELFSNAPRLQIALPSKTAPAPRPRALADENPPAAATPMLATAETRPVAAKAAATLAAARSEEPLPAPASTQVARAKVEVLSAVAQPASVNPVVANQSPTLANALRFQQLKPRNAYRRNLNSPPPPEVLTAFELQRAGQDIRVLDADGSVYHGNVQSQSAATADQPFAFRAEGTNQTLNQRVVFTGEFNPAGNSFGNGSQNQSTVSAGQVNQIRAAGQAVSASNQSQAGPASNNQMLQGRIQGRAAIGQSSELKIEAQQVDH